MLKLTKILAGMVATGSMAYADDTSNVIHKWVDISNVTPGVTPGKAPAFLELPEVPLAPLAPAKLPTTKVVQTPAPAVPMPAAPTTVPPSTMTVISSTTVDPGNKLWFGADYGIYRTQRSPFPNPLVVFAPPLQLPTATNRGTNVLFGQDNVEFGNATGMNLTLGGWLNSDRTIGVEASMLLLREQSLQRGFSSQFPIGNNVAIPYTRQSNGVGSLVLVSGTLALATGGVNIDMQTQFWGYDAKVVYSLDRTDSTDLELVTGYRFLSLDEKFVMTTNSRNILGGNAITSDSFKTFNDFNGGQVGLRRKHTIGSFGFDVSGLLSLGYSHQTLEIAGSRSSSGLIPARPRSLPFGILTQASDIGSTTRDSFSVVPEVNAKVSYNITSNLALSVGYQGIYWTNVMRPGNQIDSVLNHASTLSSLVPQTPANGHPLPVRTSTDFWAQGLLFGLNLKY